MHSQMEHVICKCNLTKANTCCKSQHGFKYNYLQDAHTRTHAHARAHTHTLCTDRQGWTTVLLLNWYIWQREMSWVCLWRKREHSALASCPRGDCSMSRYGDWRVWSVKAKKIFSFTNLLGLWLIMKIHLILKKLLFCSLRFPLVCHSC